MGFVTIYILYYSTVTSHCRYPLLCATTVSLKQTQTHRLLAAPGAAALLGGYLLRWGESVAERNSAV